jgi:RHS repeat-associated protein
MYDEQGRLVGEYDNSGKLIQETVWMNDLPIATIRPKGANASTPFGITGTGAATANNLGTNTAANPVNVDFFYVHPDHLGSPRVVTKPADNKKVWEWQSQPFGEGAANENPQNLTGAALTAGQFRYNLRFPGQVFDAETSKHYNYFRDYDPALGRYLESDPIGLKGGISTFAYVGNYPLNSIDPRGLDRPPKGGCSFQLWLVLRQAVVEFCKNPPPTKCGPTDGCQDLKDKENKWGRCYVARLAETLCVNDGGGHEQELDNALKNQKECGYQLIQKSKTSCCM